MPIKGRSYALLAATLAALAISVALVYFVIAVYIPGREAYGAMFMDCQMPELDGYEATLEIRRRENGGRRIPILALTAHSMSTDRDRCIATGMDDYLSKPVNSGDLARVLARWLPEQIRSSQLGSPIRSSPE